MGKEEFEEEIHLAKKRNEETSQEFKNGTENHSEQSKKEKVDENGKTDTYSEEWKIQPCHVYDEEYQDCKSNVARFHQMFVFGEHVNCTQWKIDANNCWKWKRFGNEEAYKELLESVNNRRMERLRPHVANNVWKKREKPPSDWNAPLPKWYQERINNSYVTYRLNQLEGTASKEEKSSSCCIL